MKIDSPVTTPAPANPSSDPAPAIARAAGLRYVGDHQAGIARRGKPGKFHYLDADGPRL